MKNIFMRLFSLSSSAYEKLFADMFNIF